jgi:hypothetical protein
MIGQSDYFGVKLRNGRTRPTRYRLRLRVFWSAGSANDAVQGSRRREEAGIEVNRQTLPRYLVSYANLTGQLNRYWLGRTLSTPEGIVVIRAHPWNPLNCRFRGWLKSSHTPSGSR